MNRTHVLLLACACLVGSSASAVHGDGLVVPVLGEQWIVVAQTPPLRLFQGQRHDAGYRYQGTSADGFNISCFVENPAKKNGGHADCFEHYWPKAKRNPLIDPRTVTVAEGDAFVKVSYVYTTLSPKLPKHNVNYYIARDGRWIDIHISMVSALPREDIVKAFEDSLRFVPVASLLPAGKKQQVVPGGKPIK